MTANSRLLSLAHQRLAKVLGDQEATRRLQLALERAGLDTVESPEALLVVAEQLIGEAGLIKFVGQSVKAQALLMGASGKSVTVP